MRRDRFGLIDTSEKAEERYFEMLRSKTPEQRLQQVWDLIEMTKNLRRQAEALRKRSSQ